MNWKKPSYASQTPKWRLRPGGHIYLRGNQQVKSWLPNVLDRGDSRSLLIISLPPKSGENDMETAQLVSTFTVYDLIAFFSHWRLRMKLIWCSPAFCTRNRNTWIPGSPGGCSPADFSCSLPKSSMLSGSVSTPQTYPVVGFDSSRTENSPPTGTLMVSDVT